MLKIGLTGGVASGKSMVAALFEECGAALIDTDVLAREITEPGEPALAEIRTALGASFVDNHDRLDRAAVRQLIFRDPAARQRLETILHPRIRTRVIEQLAQSGTPYVIVVVPLLVETDFNKLVDRVLVVDCEVSTQLQRLMQRDSIEEPLGHAMIDAQTERNVRLAAADDIVDNNGSAEATRAQVLQLHALYLSLGTDVCRAHTGRAE